MVKLPFESQLCVVLNLTNNRAMGSAVDQLVSCLRKMLFNCSAVQLLVAQDELFVSQLIEDILDQLLLICSAAYYSRLPL
jgi:hypothetical protein